MHRLTSLTVHVRVVEGGGGAGSQHVDDHGEQPPEDRLGARL
jgi:hypothetical protein